ncbi:MAG: hypothetical protein U1E05_15965 [Patescibacteria group bacterium]|nr:hypothetical protein [Patescibacteria group bacterium]
MYRRDVCGWEWREEKEVTMSLLLRMLVACLADQHVIAEGDALWN